MSQPRVDASSGQGLKVERPQSDDWQRELQVTPCSQPFKNKILEENGQEASIKHLFIKTLPGKS